MLILFSLMACIEPSMRRVDALSKRVEKADDKFQDIEKQFDELIEDYTRVDSVLKSSNTSIKEMVLFRLYLQQYEDVRDEMTYDIDYSNSQLKKLKNDMKKGLYDESQRTEYLDSEEKVMDMIEARLDYFSERFKEQKEFVKSVR